MVSVINSGHHNAFQGTIPKNQNAGLTPNGRELSCGIDLVSFADGQAEAEAREAGVGLAEVIAEGGFQAVAVSVEP